MVGLVVEPQTCRHTGGRVPVDGDPSQDLVSGPRVVVRPVVEFLIQPGEESNRGVGKCAGERLPFRLVEEVVGHVVTVVEISHLETGTFVRRVGRDELLEPDNGVLEQGRWEGFAAVDV